MAIDVSIVREAIPVLLEGLRVTALVSVIGIPLGVAIGIVAAYAAQSRTILRPIALGYVEGVRNIPYLILVYLSFFGLPKLGVGASAMTVAVGCTAFYTGGYFCEILRAAIGSIERGQWEAAASIGMTRAQTLRRAILPQAMRTALPPLGNSFISLVKDTALAATIQVPELFRQAQLITARTFEVFTMYLAAALIYWILATVLSHLQNKLEERVNRHDQES